MPVFPLDSEREKSERILEDFIKAGGKYVLAHYDFQVKRAAEMGLCPVSSYRSNATNSFAAGKMCSYGAYRVILSPELTLAAQSSVRNKVSSSGSIVYGRLPIMTLRRCVLRGGACGYECKDGRCSRKGELIDRHREKMIILPVQNHLSVIYNAYKLWGADLKETRRVDTEYFIFTDESAEEIREVIDSYKKRDEGRLVPPPENIKFRRI
jgi:hypothetical protein